MKIWAKRRCEGEVVITTFWFVDLSAWSLALCLDTKDGLTISVGIGPFVAGIEWHKAREEITSGSS